MSLDTPNLGEGSLERLGISLETAVPGEILTPNMIRAMRLRKQEPRGYAYVDVNSAREQMVDSATWYIAALHQRDLDVHRLGAEVDKLQSAVLNAQIELAREAYNAPVREALQQSESDPEVELLGQKVRDLGTQLEAAEVALAAAQAQLRLANERVTELEKNGYDLSDEAEPQQFAEPEPAQGLSDEERAEHTAALSERDERIRELEAELAVEQSRVAALNEYRVQTDEYISQIEADLEQYENAAGIEQQEPVPAVEVPVPGEEIQYETAVEPEEDEGEDESSLSDVELESVQQAPQPHQQVEESVEADAWSAEPVAPIGYESEFDTDEGEEPRDTDPEQPVDAEFFQEREAFNAPLDSPEDTATAQQTVAWNPDLLDNEEEIEVPLPGRNTVEPTVRQGNPVIYNGKPLPSTVTLADLEED